MLRAHATIVEEADGLAIQVTWTGAELDRPSTGGWVVKRTHRALAERLVRAIEAGKVFKEPTLRRDIYGKTYVSASARVLGRTMNADLRRLGF